MCVKLGLIWDYVILLARISYNYNSKIYRLHCAFCLILDFLQEVIRGNKNRAPLDEAAGRVPNASNTTVDNDPMEVQAIISDVLIADSESSLLRGFRNLLNSPSNEEIDGK
ncbi:hypothetical protein RO3G_03325 [Rhizopus delemar RA 99-880]|uniref:Uncharacterized protein n=1 Tax=Rhizopus delemar (strain RA 99-880 / ATCC MYA-4621 / FGSC 9543 / NRRL 43880) TaxID=246409 RepID=I1BQZ1_RHIO9|nr:hypothetical protein RO3G_03325 [Rhizopus delemar RA 99-880]|eukprot:EIE78621.1 hypothetical protein RO3G_03325 [Rhizopus delemar RA 99-880]